MSKTTELFKVGQPKASAYIGMASPTRPLEVTALQIPDGCQIQFDRVEWQDGLTKETFDCGVGDVWSSERGRMRYSLCDCVPFLDGKVQRLYIDTPGHYIAVIVPEDGCLGMIEAYVREAPEMAGLLDDRLRGCCGLPQADLQAIKTTPLPRYKVGQPFSYSIRLLNAGPSNASGAEVRDLLPQELELSSAITLAYGNGAMGPATLTREQLASFEVTSFPPTGYVDVTITGTFHEHGAYLNRVCIQPPEGVEDINQGNNCSQVLINIDELQPKLEVSKTASDINPLTGTIGVFTIVVSNSGEDPETNVVLTDVLPSEFTYTTPFSVTTSGATGVPATVTPVQLAAGVVIAATMPPGSSVTVTIPYAIPASAAGKPVRNRATAKGALSESSDDVIVTPLAPSIDLSVEKVASNASPAVGDISNFTVTYTNAGPAAANGTTIRDQLSNAASLGITGATVIGLAYAGGASGPATTTISAIQSGVVIPTLPAGGTVTATYGGVVQVGYDGQTIVNTATIAPPAGVTETNTTNNTATVYVQVQGECYLKCDEDLVWFSDPTASNGFGVCFATGTTAGFMWPANQAGFGRLPITITNPWPVDALLRVDMVAQANLASWGATSGVGYNQSIAVFAHTVGTDPSPAVPETGSDGTAVFSNWAFTNVDTRDLAFVSIDPAAGPSSQETGNAVYVQRLGAGQSVTLYALWYVNVRILDGNEAAIHGGYSIKAFLHRGLA